MSPVSRRGGRGSAHLRLLLRCPTGIGRRRRHQGEEGDATPDLFVKHPDAIFEDR
jgi:hypothetical protein